MAGRQISRDSGSVADNEAPDFLQIGFRLRLNPGCLARFLVARRLFADGSGIT